MKGSKKDPEVRTSLTRLNIVFFSLQKKKSHIKSYSIKDKDWTRCFKKGILQRARELLNVMTNDVIFFIES